MSEIESDRWVKTPWKWGTWWGKSWTSTWSTVKEQIPKSYEESDTGPWFSKDSTSSLGWSMHDSDTNRLSIWCPGLDPASVKVDQSTHLTPICTWSSSRLAPAGPIFRETWIEEPRTSWKESFPWEPRRTRYLVCAGSLWCWARVSDRFT